MSIIQGGAAPTASSARVEDARARRREARRDAQYRKLGQRPSLTVDLIRHLEVVWPLLRSEISPVLVRGGGA